MLRRLVQKLARRTSAATVLVKAWRWRLLWLLVVVLALWLVVWIIFLPDLANSGVEGLASDARIERRTGFRTVLVQVLLGLGILVGAVYAARRFELSRSEHALERDKTTSSDYAKAVEMLASDRMAERLGGIYALGRIAQSSPRDHWTIIQVLTAWLRDESPESLNRDERIREDFHAVAVVLRDRVHKQDKFGAALNLTKVNLIGAPLTEAHLDRVRLPGAFLETANLSGAALSMARLQGAHLGGARLRRTTIKSSDFTGAELILANLSLTVGSSAVFFQAKAERAIFLQANLKNADFQNADLRGSSFDGAILPDANFASATLAGASFRDTVLSGANFASADLTGASFTGAELGGADFSDASLDGCVFKNARISDKTIWPDGFDPFAAKGLRQVDAEGEVS